MAPYILIQKLTGTKYLIWLLIAILFVAFVPGCRNQVAFQENEIFVDSILAKTARLGSTDGAEVCLHFLDSALYGKELSRESRFRTYNERHNIAYVRLHNYAQATTYADSMLLIISLEPEKWDTNYIFKAYMLKANAEYAAGQFGAAFKYYEKARELAFKNGSPCQEYIYSYRMAMALYREEKFLEAARLFKLAYSRSDYCSHKDRELSFRRQEILGNTGLAYSKVGMYDSSLWFYNATFDFIKVNQSQFPSSQTHWMEAISVVYGNLGDVYKLLNKTDSAEVFFKKSILLNETNSRNTNDRQFNLLKLAGLYIDAGKMGLASSTLNRTNALDATCRPNRTEEDNVEFDFRTSKIYSSYYTKLGDYRKAMEFINIHDSLRTVKWQFTNAILTNDLQTGIDNITNERQINLLEKDVQISKQQNIILVLTIVLSLGGLIFIYFSLRKFGRKYKRLEITNETITRESARKEAALQEKIRADELNFMALIENTDDFLWSVDRNLNLLAFNKAFKEHYFKVHGDYPQTGKPENVIEFNTSEHEKLETGYNAVLAGRPYEIVGKGVPVNGIVPDIEVRFRAIKDEQGNVMGVSCFRRDITEYVKLIQKLERNNEQLKNIAWVQSHKLRGPLSTMMGIIELLNDPQMSEGHTAELKVSLSEKLQEMDDIIHEIVNLTE